MTLRHDRHRQLEQAGGQAGGVSSAAAGVPGHFLSVIYQSTTAGTSRGGSMAEKDAGTVVQVQEGVVAVCEKNRYSGEDLRYLVFYKRIVEDKV